MFAFLWKNIFLPNFGSRSWAAPREDCAVPQEDCVQRRGIRNDAAPLLHFPSNSKNLAGPALEWARFLNFPDRQDADDLPKPSRNYAARVPRNCAGRCRAQLRGTVPRPATLSPKHIWTWHLKRHPIMCPFGKANIWKSWMHAHGGSRTCTRMKSKKTNNQPPKTKRTWTSKSQNVRIHVFAAKKKSEFRHARAKLRSLSIGSEIRLC